MSNADLDPDAFDGVESGLFAHLIELRARLIRAVAGLGLFVLLSWLLARALGPRQALPLPPETQADSTASSLSQPSRHGDEAAAVAELPGRARVAR